MLKQLHLSWMWEVTFERHKINHCVDYSHAIKIFQCKIDLVIATGNEMSDRF
jgi:hypothetical protein